MNNLSTIADYARSYSSTCSSTGVTLPTVPISSVQSGLAQTKQDNIDSRAGLIDSSFVSDRTLKENVTPVDRHEVLKRVKLLPIARWNDKAQGSSVQHLGPMAQDFQAAGPASSLLRPGERTDGPDRLADQAEAVGGSISGESVRTARCPAGLPAARAPRPSARACGRFARAAAAGRSAPGGADPSRSAASR